LAGAADLFPCVGLVVSGGHTSLYRCDTAINFTLLGGTIDDAAGEAFDKVASLLGLAYPGGPAIQRAAAGGNPKKYQLPRAFIHEQERIAFSFSGLKTAVRYQIAPPGETPNPTTLTATQLADLAASFQEAVVDCLVAKSLAALKLTGLTTLAVGGGVAANSRFRERLEAACKDAGFRAIVAPRELCTDNAAMGAIAIERLRAGLVEPLSLDVRPGLVR
jgi:N6-L-threonylcarbamoyladenine synthase